MSDYPMLISNKLHSFRNFAVLILGFNLRLLEENVNVSLTSMG